MYTEGFEGLEEAEKASRRSYGQSSEIDRLIRENNKLKESLEKEKFFNKLLDQEIQDLKTNIPNGGRTGYPSEYWSGNRRVSRGAFYTLLFVSLLMAAYIGYGIYYDKKFSYLNNIAQPSAAVEAVPDAAKATDQNIANNTPTPASQTNSNTQAKTESVSQEPQDRSATNSGQTTRPNIPPVVKDSVPNIIGNKKAPAADKKKAAVSKNTDEEYNEEEVDAAINEPVKPTPRPAAIQTVNTPKTAEASTPASARQVIANYKVTSKANFYNSPDENAMRGTFISGGGDKTVGALEDKNGFIYVEYTNDLGFTSKGWLSKKDLTKE
jgi:hypothetical protein